MSAAEALCRTLAEVGARHVFGLPGTQNLELTEALRRSDLAWVVPSHELAAAFMANGYYRASGRPGVVATIPGPGFAWALAGLAEARLDSAAVLCLTGAHPGEPGGRHRLQEIPQAGMARPVVKDVVRIRAAGELPAKVAAAYRATVEGEPGPVLVEIEDPVWSERLESGATGVGRAPEDAGTREKTPTDDEVDRLAGRLAAARRPLLVAGQGVQEGADALRELVEVLGAPVLLSTSGRGGLPESHPLALALDRLEGGAEAANRLATAADLVLVLGCKLGHNATLGFRLALPAARTVRVDASAEVLGEAPERASLALRADVPGLLERLLERREAWEATGERWPDGLPGGGTGERDAGGSGREPRAEGAGSMADFFGAVRRALPPEACLVTDSGLHQMMARRHYRVESPRGLLTPTNFQSMGYGIPAAVGAALATPDRPVVALVGDGGLRLSAFELSTAREAGVDLAVLVFVDGHYGLIRRGQLGAYGRSSGTDLPDLDLEALCGALGVRHHRIVEDPGGPLERWLREGDVWVMEVRLEDPGRVAVEAAGVRLKEEVRRALGPEVTERLRGLKDTWRRRGEER